MHKKVIALAIAPLEESLGNNIQLRLTEDEKKQYYAREFSNHWTSLKFVKKSQSLINEYIFYLSKQSDQFFRQYLEFINLLHI